MDQIDILNVGDIKSYLEIFAIYNRDNSNDINKTYTMSRCICGTYIEKSIKDLNLNFLHSCGCKRYDRSAYVGNKNPRFKGCGDIGINYMQTLRACAKTREIQFDVTIEQIWDLFLKQDSKCAFSNESLCFSSPRQRAKGFEQTASLDRIDSSKGYTIDNIQWVHKDVNYMKGKMSDEELISICTKVHNYQINKPDLHTISCDTSIHQYFHPQNWKGVGEIGLNHFREIKDKAAKRHLPFEITLEYLWNLFLEQKRLCPMTGELLQFSNFRNRTKFGLEQTASLDRIDSTKGYIKGNIQWIHKNINWMKHNMSQDRFLELCEKISNQTIHEAVAA